MTADPVLIRARDEILTLLGELCDTGLDDTAEALVKLSGIRDVCRELRTEVERRADERAERVEDEHDAGWTVSFNRGG